MQNYDVIIRGGTVVDGLGGKPYVADIAIKDGVIDRIGVIEGKGREDVDASGCIVTPGFVDIHTHFDGQATWASRMAPASNHGVTTVITGNCGVGFAPCRESDREALIKLMEGVEDIPGAVMSEGLPWSWQSFPEYMDYLAERSFDVNIGVQLPHAPLRVFVMGQRGLDREPATMQDIAAMKALVSEAVSAGAFGVSTSRSLNHRSSEYQLMPGVSAAEAELIGLARGVAEAGRGVFQCITDFAETQSEFRLLERIAADANIPLSFSLMQIPGANRRWEEILDLLEQANARGVAMKGQVYPRPIGVILGLEFAWNLFSLTPTYQRFADRPFEERVERMKDPAVRQAILAEYPCESLNPIAMALNNLDNVFPMWDEPDYLPTEDQSLAHIARSRGVAPAEYAYDLMIANDGKSVLYVPALNYADKSPQPIRRMLAHDCTLYGLGDGGAHVGIICDASAPTYLLSKLTGKGEDKVFTLERAVNFLTHRNARAMGIEDRGSLEPGKAADINIIDFHNLKLGTPYMVYDLPLGGGRLHQDASGYVATFVGGVATYLHGQPTGQLPGRLLRN